MRNRNRTVLVATAFVGALFGAPSSRPAGAAEGSLRYSAVVIPDEDFVLHGWQASLRPVAGRRFSLVLDAAGYYASGGGLYVLTAGPRVSWPLRGNGTTVFAQVLAGVALVSPDETLALALAQPGVGVDLLSDRPLGVRLQADWPLITTYGVVAAAPRISAGIVWRPGLRRR